MSSSLTVGYIGLGLMGKSIARNILKAGFPLVVHNRSRGAVDELVAEGAIAAVSPAEVAAQVDVVFTNLPDSPDVELVALGADGIIAGAHAGLIFVDNSTIKPATARMIAADLAEKGVLQPGCARQRRRYRRAQRHPDDHGRRPGRCAAKSDAGLPGDGQDHHPRRRQPAPGRSPKPPTRSWSPRRWWPWANC